MSRRVTKTILKLAAEYVIVTAPILIYTSIEAVSKQQVIGLFRSPEWSIATIFLTIQTIRMYLEAMDETSGHPFSSILILVLVGITLAAGINIYIALDWIDNQSLGTIITKWALLFVASAGFVYVAGAAIYSSER